MHNSKSGFQKLHDRIVACTLCPRLVEWREQIAREKVRRFAEQGYWGKPIPGFGDLTARLLIIGLAPAAHGANRTGRMFTGDRSGDWLYRSLHKFGFANQAMAVHREDGLELHNCYITAALHCAPPQNKPTAEERKNCFAYLVEEIELLKYVEVVVVLGKLSFDTTVKLFRNQRPSEELEIPKFTHGAEGKLTDRIWLIASYHPSQQNTFTGKLTEPMFDSIFARVQQIIDEKN